MIEVRLNNTVLGTLKPSRVGETEKFDLTVPASAVIPDDNRIWFTNRGSPGGTEYELIRIQNYRSIISKGKAYVVLSKSPQTNFSFRLFFLIAGVVFITLIVVMSIFLRLTRQQRPQLLVVELLASAPALLLAGIVLLGQSFPGYRLVFDSQFYLTTIGIIFVGGHILVVVVLVFPILLGGLSFLLDWLSSLRLGQGTRKVAETTGQRFGFILKKMVLCCWKSVSQIGPWFVRQQCPKGYARFFCYLAILTLFELWVLQWRQWAEVTASLAAGTLMIAIIWESRFNPEKND
jgi:hypothetical protein